MFHPESWQYVPFIGGIMAKKHGVENIPTPVIIKLVEVILPPAITVLVTINVLQTKVEDMKELFNTKIEFVTNELDTMKSDIRDLRNQTVQQWQDSQQRRSK